MKKLSFFISAIALFAVSTSFAADELPTMPTCESLGYIMEPKNCKGQFNACPFNKDKVICLAEPAVGDIKYSLKTSNHDGWLLCNGDTCDSSKYSALCNLLRNNGFGTNLPDYRGFFLRGKGSAVGSSTALVTYGGSPNYSFAVPQKEELPNIKGTWTDTVENQKYQAPTGAISQSSKSGNGADGNDGWFGYMKFDASKTSGSGNVIYKENGHVIPRNYAAYIFIYAGK